MPEIPFGDWITAFLTISYLQLLTWRKWYAWPLGMFTQVVWIYLTASKGMYGLTFLSVVLMCQFGYGWYRWTMDIDPATGKEFVTKEMGDQ